MDWHKFEDKEPPDGANIIVAFRYTEIDFEDLESIFEESDIPATIENVIASIKDLGYSYIYHAAIVSKKYNQLEGTFFYRYDRIDLDAKYFPNDRENLLMECWCLIEKPKFD